MQIAFLLLFLLFGGASGQLHAQIPAFQTTYVTRAEAIMLMLQARVPRIPVRTSNGEFSDIPAGAWYERYIVIAERLDIVDADPVTKRMRPEDPVSRAEFVTMGAKTFGINTTYFSPSYSDVPARSSYAGAAGMAQDFRLFPGDVDPKKFQPNAFMTHEEVSKSVQILGRAAASGGPWNDSPAPGKISTTTERIALIPRGPSTRPASIAVRKASRVDSAQTKKLQDEVLTLINAERSAAALPRLSLNRMLQTSAQEYAIDMATNGFFGHVSPSGEILKQRMERSGYYSPFPDLNCLCIVRYVMGENLARGQKTAREVVLDWMQSPSHREAILNPVFTDTGIGLHAGVWVEHFGGKQK